MLFWQANPDVINLMNSVKSKYHSRLEQANIALCFMDAKSFVKNRFNWGKTSKFSNLNKIWQSGQKYDFCITLPSDAWHDILTNNQREALIDLHLCRCSVEYLPQTQEVNGKKVVIKDEHGRVQYTTEMKTEDDGTPKWTVLPLDLPVFSDNIKHYGLWLDDLSLVKDAIENHVEA